MTAARGTGRDGRRGGIARVGAVLLGFAATLVAFHAKAADSAASSWFETDQGKVRLIAATTAVGSAETVQLGLEFSLAPGWKVYWRSPGDAGLPPTIDWAGSENLAGAAFAWPAPRRFSAYGLATVGYADAVVLPIAARLATPGQPLHLAAALQYLTCKEICIPYDGKLTLDLPAGPASASPHADLIARYLARVPGDGSASGLS